ncbi:MAG: hypothetical protein BM485_00525 [Desulfobulbaceae bacterium DB1]|nr:MAG: hypothetical protein BM485_00525 [Desulfobulbaceae bacterium DB1]
MDYANQRLEGCLEPLFNLVRRQNACILKIKNENHLHKILYRPARDTGISREGLYRALGTDGNPEFTTILKVIKALGLRLRAEPTH